MLPPNNEQERIRMNKVQRTGLTLAIPRLRPERRQFAAHLGRQAALEEHPA